jgi:hypothetical protein
MYAGVPMFFLMTVGYLSLLGGFNTESFLPRYSECTYIAYSR